MTSTVNVLGKEPKMRNKGFFRSQYAAGLLALPASAVNFGIIGGMRKVSQLSKEDTAQLTHAARKGLHESGLYEKGVRTYKINEISLVQTLKKIYKSPAKALDILFKVNKKDNPALNVIKEELRSGKRYKNVLKKHGSDIAELYAENSAKAGSLMYKFGLNAGYFPHANKIITPNKSLQTSVFHEMGHALNNNGGIILKSLQKMRPVSTFAPAVILLMSLLNKRKTTDETNKNDSAMQKGADFVKRNAGKLTALSFLPMVAEEGIASLRGQGIAKKLVKEGTLSKDLFKKIKLTNLGGFSTYALAAAVAVVTTKLAISIKDKIQAKYEAKQKAKFEAKNNK